MQFKFLEKTPLRIFGFLPMYTHWILHFGGLRTLNHEPNKQCDRLLIRDSPMNVKASWWELQLFSQPKNMTTSMIRHLRIFGRHIYELCARLHWLQSNAPDVRIIFKIFVSMLCTTNNMSLTFNWLTCDI